MSPTQRSLKHLRDEGYVVANGLHTFACARCGTVASKPARGKPYRFCSRACAVVGRDGPTKKRERQCVQCGAPLEGKRKKYCSKVCNGKAHAGAANPNYSGAGLRTCEGCGFPYHNYNKTRRFCSARCSHSESKDWGMANQRRGYITEIKCFDHLFTRGYLVMRSAGSKGPFDLVAVGKGGTYFIQVKRTKDPSRRRHTKELRKMRGLLPGNEKVAKQLWCWVDRTGWFVVDMGETEASDREYWLTSGDEFRQWRDFPPCEETKQWLALDSAVDSVKQKIQ